MDSVDKGCRVEPKDGVAVKEGDIIRFGEVVSRTPGTLNPTLGLYRSSLTRPDTFNPPQFRLSYMTMALPISPAPFVGRTFSQPEPISDDEEAVEDYGIEDMIDSEIEIEEDSEVEESETSSQIEEAFESFTSPPGMYVQVPPVPVHDSKAKMAMTNLLLDESTPVFPRGVKRSRPESDLGYETGQAHPEWAKFWPDEDLGEQSVIDSSQPPAMSQIYVTGNRPTHSKANFVTPIVLSSETGAESSQEIAPHQGEHQVIDINENLTIKQTIEGKQPQAESVVENKVDGGQEVERPRKRARSNLMVTGGAFMCGAVGGAVGLLATLSALPEGYFEKLFS
jgi:hypothetical protein